MALYVRLQASFFSHRKTAKLQASIGTDALWIVPRLWCYAATNQPDGDFAKYSAQELAILLGYSKDACSLLEALQQAGFMDDMRIHDWDEHNDYHATFVERAKNAAAVRWGNSSTVDKKGQVQDKTRASIAKQSSSNASSIDLPFPSQSFKDCWEQWETFRREIKKPNTQTSRSIQLKKLKGMGEQRALAALEHSMGNGYQGIFEPTNGHHAPRKESVI